MAATTALIQMLASQGFVMPEREAEQLWVDIKALWRAQDREDPELEPGDSDDLIFEIEQSASGNLDSAPRDALRDAIAMVCANSPWPSRADSPEDSKTTLLTIGNSLMRRGAQMV